MTVSSFTEWVMEVIKFGNTFPVTTMGFPDQEFPLFVKVLLEIVVLLSYSDLPPGLITVPVFPVKIFPSKNVLLVPKVPSPHDGFCPIQL